MSNIYTLKIENGEAVYRDKYEDVEIRVAEDDCLGIKMLPEMPVISDAKVYEDAVAKPIAGPSLAEIAKAKNAKSACVIVSDSSRGVPSVLVAKHVVKALLAGGVPMDKICFFVAIGVHRPATEAEMKEVLGDLYGKVSIENHTPFDKSNLIYLGNTKAGTPIEINKKAYECDIHVAIGKAEPHEFAGFSGGRKSVLPGIASEGCIVYNHRPENLINPKAIPGNLDGNPIHLDMLDNANAFGIDYCITFVLTGDAEPSAVFGGSLEDSHNEAVKYLRKYCDVKTGDADIIVTSPGKPLNLDFYQSQKPLIALTDALDEHSVVAMYCECPEGVMSVDMLRPYKATKTVDEMIQFATDNFKIQMDHSLLLSKIIKKGAKVVVYSPNVAREDIEDMYYIYATSIEDMMAKAKALSGKANPKVLFYPQAQKTLPIR